MKKLMIAAAIVCAAVCANASTCQWQLLTDGSPLYTDKGALFSGTGYMLSGEVSEAFITAMAGGASFDAAIAAQTTAGTVTFANGETSSQFAYGTEEVGYDFTLVVKMADTIFVNDDITYRHIDGYPDDSDPYMIDANCGWTEDAGDRAKYTFKMKDGYEGYGYYTTEPVPEPTSGLLMLLGMAGLALKRKRA